MDPKEIASYVAIILGFISIMIHVKGFFSSGEKQLSDRITAVQSETDANEKKLVEHDRRIQSVESDIKHLPDRETTHRMEISMMKIMGRLDAQDATLAGRFSAMEERLNPIQAIGERLQDILIDQAKKVA